MSAGFGCWGIIVTAFAVVQIAAAAPSEGSAPCVRCHESAASVAAATGGHAENLACADCHPDRGGQRVGRRHRVVLPCTTHHDEIAHPPTAERRRHPVRACLTCHEPHGSPNAGLVARRIRARGRNRPITFTDAGGAVPGGFADPERPGRGVCEVCHRRTDVYRADGRGDAHFPTQDCAICHRHTAAFAPVVSDDNCALCHEEPANRLAKPSAHHDRFARCSDCHAEASPEPGPAHRTLPTCESCHDVSSHIGTGGPLLGCTTCHDAHGSDNIRLIRESIQTPQGPARPVVLRTLGGRLDGGQASPTTPGSGVCEVCHTTTRFYRADGTGEPHLASDCRSCHDHQAGFAGRVADDTCAICHSDQATRFTIPSGHQADVAVCSECHAEVSPTAGPGHRALRNCTECHSETTHVPAGWAPLACAQCHDPHGTTNLRLIRETITTPQGPTRPISFLNRNGRADGSFASVTSPGSGVCEVCHTTTDHYRADGSGTPHYTLPCYPCHTHGDGFLP